MNTVKLKTVHTSGKAFAITSKGLLVNNAHLSVFLDSTNITPFKPNNAGTYDAILAWGKKPSSHAAVTLAKENDLALLRIEDGFLRSLGGGIKSRHAASMVIDDIGIYFDSHHTSRLEWLILDKPVLSSSQQVHAQQVMQHIVDLKLSKYNLAPEQTLNSSTTENILIVDQTYGDQSVVGAGADANSFHHMLRVALESHPNATIWIKTHPQAKSNNLSSITKTLSGDQPKGYFSNQATSTRIKKITDAFNPISLIQQVDAVYVVSSHMGFEALMCGKPVYCFGVPWYAGWGLTDDTNASQTLLTQVIKRRKQQTAMLDSLFYHAYINYSRYVNPATSNACEINDVIQWLFTNREWQQALSAHDIDLYKLSAWKLNVIPSFIDFPNIKRRIKYFRFDSLEENTSSNRAAIAWGDKQVTYARKHYSKVWCMEDGFIRSRGLGAQLIAPSSIVLDDLGIYYNSTKACRLESLLNSLTLSKIQENRAAKLRSTLLSKGVSKYNVGNAFLWPDIPKKKKVILVPGQVEDDASVLLSQSSVKTNLALLKAVRHNEPDAFIIYKPHPDVQAKLRQGYVSPSDMSVYADAVIDKIDMPNCLSRVDAIHTISSLTGFEALLRDVAVTCYGLPFYAGWGLTHDKVISKRRKRQINLNTLIYAALIAYPIYHLPHGHGLAEVEDLIGYLQNQNSKIKQKQWRVTNLMQQRHRFLSFLSRHL